MNKIEIVIRDGSIEVWRHKDYNPVRVQVGDGYSGGAARSYWLDPAHKVQEGLMKCGLSEAQAKSVISALYEGKDDRLVFDI